MANRAHEPTEETRARVESLAAAGIKREDIALYLGITRPTLDKYYSEELDIGTIKANAAVARTLYQQAIEGNTTAMIFWLKTRAGWRETQRVEMSADVKTELNGKITLADLMLENYAKKGVKNNVAETEERETQ